jgi:hypothetical protein
MRTNGSGVGCLPHLLVELDLAVEVFLNNARKVLDLLHVVRLHLGHRRVKHRLAARRDDLAGLLALRGLGVPKERVLVRVDDGLW